MRDWLCQLNCPCLSQIEPERLGHHLCGPILHLGVELPSSPGMKGIQIIRHLIDFRNAFRIEDHPLHKMLASLNFRIIQSAERELLRQEAVPFPFKVISCIGTYEMAAIRYSIGSVE